MPSYGPSLRCLRKVFWKNKREVRVFKIRWPIVFTLLRTNKLSDQSKRNILKKRRRGNGSRALQVLESTKWQMFEIWSCWNNSWSTEQMSCYIGHVAGMIISKNWKRENCKQPEFLSLGTNSWRRELTCCRRRLRRLRRGRRGEGGGERPGEIKREQSIFHFLSFWDQVYVLAKLRTICSPSYCLFLPQRLVPWWKGKPSTREWFCRSCNYPITK